MIETDPGTPAAGRRRLRLPEIIAFCCNYCAYAAADLAGSKRMQYPTNVRIIHAPCTGKIEMEHILEAFEQGHRRDPGGRLPGRRLPLPGRQPARAQAHATASARCWTRSAWAASGCKMVNLSAAMAPTFVRERAGDGGDGQAPGPEPAAGIPQPESESPK